MNEHSTVEQDRAEAALAIIAAMPKYRSHKVVAARKIEQVSQRPMKAGGYLVLEGEPRPLPVPQGFMDKHEPKEGGYLVAYEDGYLSWSPAEAFEAGYALEAGAPTDPEGE